MSQIKKSLHVMPIALALLLLCGCSGGAGGDGLTAGGGIGGSGITVGSVSKFGSVFVNAVEFDTAGAEVVVDGVEKGSGDQAVRDNLAIGKLVRIEGPSAADGTGTAQRIAYNADIIGPVENATALDANTSKLVVMGQTVIADSQTDLVNITLATIAVGNVVVVSGFGDDQGFIHAGYLNKRADVYAAGSEVQVRGNATDVNTLLQTFKINQLMVDYSKADVSQLANGALQTGQFLEAKGTLNAGGTLVAGLVKPENILGVDNAEHVAISGIVTLFNSLNDFEVGGIPVTTDAVTEYKGILEEDLAAGSYVLVKGSVTNGEILADTIQSNAPVKIEANVAIADAASRSLTLIDLDGITVTVNDFTRIVGAAATVSDLDANDHVKVFGKSFSTGAVTADKVIVKKNASSKVELKGRVVDVSGPIVSVLGVEIDTSGIPENGFFSGDGRPMSRTEFASRVKVGDSLYAKGAYLGARVDWQSAELEEDN